MDRDGRRPVIPAGPLPRHSDPWMCYMRCRVCRIETGSDAAHGPMVDRFAEVHTQTEGHTTVSGSRPLRAVVREAL